MTNGIINLRGKDYPTYGYVLNKAHEAGLIGIKTEMLQMPTKENEWVCVIKAIALTKDGQYEGIGDASPRSVNPMIVPHLIRMAETRAKGRALRDLCNIGQTLLEELGEVDNV